MMHHESVLIRYRECLVVRIRDEHGLDNRPCSEKRMYLSHLDLLFFLTIVMNLAFRE